MSDKDGISRLKAGLYSRTEGQEIDPNARTPLSRTHEKVDGIWHHHDSTPKEEPAAPQEPAAPALQAADGTRRETPLELIARMQQRTKSKSYAPLFLWGSLIFFVVAAAYASFTFFGGGNTISTENIDLQIVAPSLVDSGKPATIEYIINNRNNAKLLAADLVIDYPDGTRTATGPSAALPRDRLSLGDIDAGGQIKQTASAAFFGQEGTQEKVSVTLEYQIAGSNAIFVKQADTSFVIGSSPVSLSLSAPTEAISGQPFTMDLTVQSNATTPLTDLALQVQYPFGFSVSSTDPKADASNTFWRLGALSPGASKVIHINGTLTGEDGDERVLHFLVGSQPDQTATTLSAPLLTVPQDITVKKPFISAQIALDGQTGKTVSESLGRTVQGTINWENNLPDAASNLSFELSLSGAAIDQSSINAGTGFYDSSKSSIVWTPSQDPNLSSVPSGAQGTYQFSFATLPASQAQTLLNPSLQLNLTVHATRGGQSGSVPEDISSAASITANLASAVALQAQAEYASGPFTNTGPVPPAPNQKTQYAIVWTVKNSSNTIAGAQVQTVLPPYVDFVASQSGFDQVTYDAGSRTVTWSLGDVRAGAGYTSPARQTAFHVVLTPSTSQHGQAPQLTGDTSFSGEDRFAQTSVAASAPGPTTATGETGVNGTVQ